MKKTNVSIAFAAAIFVSSNLHPAFQGKRPTPLMTPNGTHSVYSSPVTRVREEARLREECKMSPIHDSASSNDTAALQELLHAAAAEKYPDEIRLMLKSCSGLFGFTALYVAAKKGNIECVIGLVEFAKQYFEDDRIKEFLDQQIELTGSTALSIATEEGNFEVAAYIFEQGADPDLADHHGDTPRQSPLFSSFGSEERTPSRDDCHTGQ
jgi:ankyrin repeat protein